MNRRSFLLTAAVSSIGTGSSTARQQASLERSVSDLPKEFELVWDRVLDDNLLDGARSPAGGYVFCGALDSSGNGGGLVVKTTSDGTISWSRQYEANTYFVAVIPVDDGYVLSQSRTADSADARLLKINQSGGVEWVSNWFGRSEDDVVYDAVRTADGGFALGGWTYSYTSSSGHDAWLVKTDDQGRKQWDRTFGTDPSFYANTILETADGGFFLAGGRWYSDAPRDAWVLKTDDQGYTEWQSSFGSDETANLFAVERTDDGYLVAGVTNEGGDPAGMVRKIDTGGSIRWTRTLLGNGQALVRSIRRFTDGTIVLGGWTGTEDEDQNALIVKLESDGTTDWSHQFQDRSIVTAFANSHASSIPFLGRPASSSDTWIGELGRESASISEIERSDVTITFDNKFRTESTDDFLGSLYNEVRQAMPIADPSLPNENEAYIHVDLRVRFDERFAESVSHVRPKFTHDQTDETFSASNIENFLGDIEYVPTNQGLRELESGVFGWNDFRIRTPVQVGIQALEAAATLFSAGASHTEVTNPLEANTEAYPNVYLTALEIQNADGETIELTVDERVPRYDDVCNPVGFSGFVNSDCVPGDDMAQFESGAMVFSPATIAIEDQAGRITGRIWEDGEYITYNEIPGAVYSGPIRHEFVLAPEGEHRIIVDGQRDGTVTLLTDRITDDGIQTATYRDITVDESTRIHGSLHGTDLQIEREREESAGDSRSPDRSERLSLSSYAEERLMSDGDRTTDDDSGSDSSTDEETTIDDGGPFAGLTTAEIAGGGVVTISLLYLATRLLSDDEKG